MRAQAAAAPAPARSRIAAIDSSVQDAKNPPTTSRTSSSDSARYSRVVLSRPIRPRAQPLVDAVGGG
jgi:hypothetical protein